MNDGSFKMDKVKKSDRKSILFLQLFLIFLVVCGGLMFVYYGFAKKNRNNVIFNETGSANYNVYLKPNRYYNSSYLDEGMSYIASLIDYIKINFNYDIDSSEKSDIEYKYNIMADLIITERDQENKILFIKPIELKKQAIINEESDGSINEIIDIKYDDYNAMVNNYKKEYSLSVSSKLVVRMRVEAVATSSNVEKENFNASNELVVSIPLSEQTIEINFDNNTINNSKEIVEYTRFNPINYIYLFIGFTLIIFGIIFFFKKIFKRGIDDINSKYNKTKFNLLREYDRFIVEASKINTVSANKNVVNVKSFNELLDARDNTDNPIIFYEDVNIKRSTFMVIDNNNVFVYSINESDFK